MAFEALYDQVSQQHNDMQDKIDRLESRNSTLCLHLENLYALSTIGDLTTDDMEHLFDENGKVVKRLTTEIES